MSDLPILDKIKKSSYQIFAIAEVVDSIPVDDITGRIVIVNSLLYVNI